MLLITEISLVHKSIISLTFHSHESVLPVLGAISLASFLVFQSHFLPLK